MKFYKSFTLHDNIVSNAKMEANYSHFEIIGNGMTYGTPNEQGRVVIIWGKLLNVIKVNVIRRLL